MNLKTIKRIMALSLIAGTISVSNINSVSALESKTVVDKNIGLTTKYSTQLKSDASTTGLTIANLYVGQDVIITDELTSNGLTWYKVNVYENSRLLTGYINSSSIMKYKYDESFESKLSQFPESYKQKIRYLHQLYPNWSFKALNTNLNFNTSASTFQKSSLVDGSDTDLRENNTVLEGNTWYRANLATTAYFVDSRNFLKASNILMFQKLGYSSDETINNIDSILSGTFMSSTESISGKTWATLFMNASNQYNVSSFYLSTRAYQEQGVNGGLGAKGGYATNNDGIKYYNIFNIGANTGAQDGINYAQSKGWDTIEKSINGGAQSIAGNYIGKGQDSVYLQRFNVNPSSSYPIYSHLYMLNIRAPYHESMKIAKGYLDSGLMSHSRTISIPIYNAEPSTVSTYPGTLKEYSSGINTLADYQELIKNNSSNQPSEPEKPVEPDTPVPPTEPSEPEDKPTTPDIPTNPDTKIDINTINIEKITNKEYNGKSIKPSVILENLILDTDYTIEYLNNINVGVATVKIKGINKYSGEKTMTFNVVAKSINNVSVSFDKEMNYTGKVIEPTVTIKDGNLSLKQNTDYKIEYADNVEVGIAKIKINGINNYKDKIEKEFTIKEIKKPSVDVPIEKPIGKPSNNKPLIDNSNKGNNGNKKENNSKKETINIGNTSVSGIKDKIYNEKSQYPNLIIKYNNQTLKQNIDYTLTYSNNKEVGKATISINGINNYSGTIEKNFYIVPEKTIVYAVCKINDDKSIIKYKDIGNVNGYEISYSKNGKDNFKNISVNSLNTETLKENIKEESYVKVRPFILINNEKKYGPYSDLKFLKLK